MKLKIRALENKGNHNEERIWFDVIEDCDLKYYLLTDTTYTSENNISNKLRHVYWFSSKLVKAGDYVVLHTKKGQQTEASNNKGTKTHTYYWGLDRAVWNDTGDCAVLFEVKAWMTKK